MQRIDARTRSRLNQARHAALEAAQRAPPGWWRSFTLMPAAGAAAAAAAGRLRALAPPAGRELPALEAQRSAGWRIWICSPTARRLDLMEGGDGSFYEWAAAADR